MDVALLWQPCNVLTRRTVADEKFPSWSWAGWLGHVIYEDTESNEKSDVEGAVPLINWHTVEPTGGISVVNKCGIDTDEESMGYEKTLTTCLWFPIFAVATQRSRAAPSEHLLHAQQGHLHFWTSCAFFDIKRKESAVEDGDQVTESRELPLLFQIKSARQHPVGVVTLTSSGPRETQRGLHEFIVLSEAQYSGFDTLTWAEKFSKQPNFCLMYNVMLIEWDNDTQIAYRIGLGRVLKSAWRSARPEVKYLVLG